MEKRVAQAAEEQAREEKENKAERELIVKEEKKRRAEAKKKFESERVATRKKMMEKELENLGPLEMPLDRLDANLPRAERAEGAAGGSLLAADRGARPHPHQSGRSEGVRALSQGRVGEHREAWHA